MTEPVRLYLIDDHALVRQGLRSMFSDSEHIEVVGEAGTVAEAIAGVATTKPNLVLVDIGLPDGGGIPLARQFLAEHPGMRVVILTMHDDEEYVRQAARAGVHGYLLKDMSASQLMEAISAVAGGDVYYPPALSQVILRTIVDGVAPVSLTERETEVLARLAMGEGNKQIADDLALSVRTIETHREHIMKKLDIHTVAGLTRYAIAEGLISAR